MKYIVIDVESENLNLSGLNRPWQISWLVCEGKKVLETQDRYIYWDKLNVSPRAAEATGFNTEKYLSLAEDPLEVYKDLARHANDKTYWVTHNGLNFDIFLIRMWLKAIKRWKNYHNLVYNHIDTNCLSKAYIEKIPVDQENFLSFQYKMKNFIKRGLKTNLKYMCDLLGIDFDESRHHDAIYDVMKTNDLFQALKYKLDLQF